MSPETRYKIEELEALTGLSRRLIYDYISRALVPPAMGSGKGAYYLSGHYDRLRLISLLRSMGFRLERIEEALQSWSPEEISRIVEFAEGRDMESLDALNDWLAPPPGAAMDFEEEWEAAAEQGEPQDRPRAEDALSSLLFAEAPAQATASDARRFSSADALERVRQSAANLMGTSPQQEQQEDQEEQDKLAAEEDAIHSDQMSLVSHMMVDLTAASDAPSPTQTWQRVQLTPDIEINFRTDIHPEERARIAALIERAKELFNS